MPYLLLLMQTFPVCLQVCWYLVTHSLYTTFVHTIHLPKLEATHTGRDCDSQYTLTPSRIVCMASVVKYTRWRVPMKTNRRLSLTYLSILLLSVSTDIELNPGPAYPCSSCGIEVLDENLAISCDSCEQWFHIQCQDVSLAYYETQIACGVSFAWTCLKCDEQNYSSVSTHSVQSFQSQNSFSILDKDSNQASCFSSLTSCQSPLSSRPQRPRSISQKTQIFYFILQNYCSIHDILIFLLYILSI